MADIQNPFDDRIYAVTAVRSADPAAGANYVHTCPANTREEIIALTFGVQAAAVAVERTVTVQAKIDTYIIPCGCGTYLYNNADTETYTFGVGMTPINGGATTTLNFDPLLHHIILDPGETFSTLIVNMEATDQLTDPTIYVRRWAITS